MNWQQAEAMIGRQSWPEVILVSDPELPCPDCGRSNAANQRSCPGRGRALTRAAPGSTRLQDGE